MTIKQLLWRLSVVMKCFEKSIISLLKNKLFSLLTGLIEVQMMLSQPSCILYLSTLRILLLMYVLFVDFSSAFNTVQPHLLVRKWDELNVHPLIIRWYYLFLTNCKQQVSVHGIISVYMGVLVHMSFLLYTLMSVEAEAQITTSLNSQMISPSYV